MAIHICDIPIVNHSKLKIFLAIPILVTYNHTTDASTFFCQVVFVWDDVITETS